MERPRRGTRELLIQLAHGSSTPVPPVAGGRGYCLRFASPAEATGGLELGDLELGGLEEACKRLGLEYLVGVLLGAQIS